MKGFVNHMIACIFVAGLLYHVYMVIASKMEMRRYHEELTKRRS